MEIVAITKIEARANDVLHVEGVVKDADDTLSLATADGWISATTNHFDAKSYAVDGHLKAKAKPRTMTAEEVDAYVRSLLAAPSAPPLPDHISSPDEKAAAKALKKLSGQDKA